MAKAYPVRHAFNAGEVSKLVDFRDDVQKYESACLTLENAVPLVEGGAKKMPGTYFAGATALGGAQFIGEIQAATMGLENASGVAGFTISRPLGQTHHGVIWSNFVIPSLIALPSDAVIQGIYPVLVASANYNAAVQYAKYGTGLDLNSTVPGTALQQPFGTVNGCPNASFPSTEFYGNSIGTLLSNLTGQEIMILLDSSLLLNNLADRLTATAVGYAVYYTSATPLTNPTIPPPFGVPVGQGLTWALPLGTSTIEPVGNGWWEITGSALSSAGVGTFNYTVIAGDPPAVGDKLATAGTTNAAGALNTSLISGFPTVATATGGLTGTYTVNGLTGGTNWPFQVETGQAITNGGTFAGTGGAGGTPSSAISVPGTGLTVTKIITGTIRVGQTITGAGVAPGTTITAYIPTTTPFFTFYDRTQTAAGLHPSGDWQYVGTQFRTHFEPVTTALADLTFSNFGFSIPSTATILGVSTFASIVSQYPTSSVLSQVSLWNSGGQLGNLKTPNSPFTTSYQDEVYGNSTDLWGAALTPAIVNDASFGFALAVATDTSRVFIGDTLRMTVYYQVETDILSGEPGGVGNYSVSITQTVGSELMETASTGKSRLVPFQFSTEQGAIIELSENIARIWEGASEGSWSLGLALQTPPSGVNYNPATAYLPGDIALVGPWAPALFYTQIFTPVIAWIPNPALGVLIIAAPYGTHFASAVPVTFTVNGSDALSVTVTGSSPNQGINIALADTTHANNSAAAIQAQIRGLGSLNAPGSNYVDLSGWTVTADSIYAASPWITQPTFPPGGDLAIGFASSFIAQVVALNTGTQFPVIYTGAFDAPFWTAFNATAQLPIELVTPYLEADLFALDCSTQSADVLWIFHASYPPGCISRTGANSWTYSTSLPGQQPGEPPYRGTLDVVSTGYSGLGQSITAISKANPCVVKVAASTPVFADGNRVYMNLIAGMVELNQGEFVVSGSTVNGDGTFSFSLLDPNTGAAVDSTGYLAYVSGGFAVQVVPMFAAAGDYPACGTLYQERLCVGGSNNKPVQMNGSVQGDFPDFICDPNQEDFAIQFSLVSTKLDQILNMVGTPNSLLLGTAGGVWVMSGTNGASLSQTNVAAAKQTSMGVSLLQPQLIDGSAIFVSRSARIVLFLLFDFASDQWNSNDLTRLNRGITLGPDETTSGIVQTSFQTEPYPIFWAVRADGQLIALVFNRQDQVYAWFRVVMPTGIIESCAVISGQNQEDQLAVVVRRTIDGLTRRYVEYFMPQELFSQLSNAFFVHCGQQWYGGAPVAITGISNANPPVVQARGHGFVDGQTVQIAGVVGMDNTIDPGPPPIVQSINTSPDQAYTVANATSNSFELAGMDTSAWTAHVSGGTVTRVRNEVSGPSYLLGQSVVAVGDGAVILEPTVVTADSISFPYYANRITIGIPYQYKLQPTNPVLSSQAATTRGMPQKLNRVTLSLYEAMSGQYGAELDKMYDITYGPGALGQAPAMSTLEVTKDMDCDWRENSTFFVTQDDPLPFTLRGIVFRMSANQD